MTQNSPLNITLAFLWDFFAVKDGGQIPFVVNGQTLYLNDLNNEKAMELKWKGGEVRFDTLADCMDFMRDKYHIADK